MSSIEIRTYVTGFPPHSFIVVTGPDGIEHGFGLVPLTPNSPNDVGHIQDDTDHRWDKSTGKIPLEDWQYQRVMDYIHESEANPPTYSAAFGSQCSTWAFMALFKADIPTSGIIPHMAPDGIIQDFLETLIFNPYTQWMNLEARDFFDSAFRWFRRRDPLVLDLNGNGIETTGANPTNPILFDHDGNGIKNGTGWVSPNDGFLVLDRN